MASHSGHHGRGSYKHDKRKGRATLIHKLPKHDRVQLLYDEIRKQDQTQFFKFSKDQLYDDFGKLPPDLNQFWADAIVRLNEQYAQTGSYHGADGHPQGNPIENPCGDQRCGSPQSGNPQYEYEPQDGRWKPSGAVRLLKREEQIPTESRSTERCTTEQDMASRHRTAPREGDPSGLSLFERSFDQLLERSTQFSQSPRIKSPPPDASKLTDLMRAIRAPTADTVPSGVPLQHSMRPAALSPQNIPQPVSTPKVTPGSATINWITSTDEYLGQFFINKVYLDKDKTQSWQPSHFIDSTTKICSLEDIIPADGLERVLASDDRELHLIKKDHCLDVFPASVEVTLLCGQSQGGRPLESKIVHLPCHGCSDAEAERDESLACKDCRRLKVQAVKSLARDHKTKFFLLRYGDHVRFIISPACLSRLQWDRFGLFGWYCDLPIKKSWANETDTGLNEFGLELHRFLGFMNISPDIYLSSVDFSVLSPAVRLVLAVQDVAVDNDVLFGFQKSDSILKNLYWPASGTRQSVCVTCGLGSNDGVIPVLTRVFQMQGVLKNIKIIYPSHRVFNSWCSKHGLKLSGEQGMCLYRNRDFSFQSYPFLHDLECSEGVPPKANVFTQYEEIKDDVNPDLIRHYGWILVGSQSVGEGSWGSQYRHSLKFYRNELAVGIFPYLEETEKGPVVHSPDLALIGQLFHSPVPYRDLPTICYVRLSEQASHVVGIVKKMRGAIMVEELPRTHCLHGVMGDADVNRYRSSHGQSVTPLLKDQIVRKSGFHSVETGNIIEFFMSSDPKSRELCVKKVIRLFNTVEDACRYYGVSYEPEENTTEPEVRNYIGKLMRFERQRGSYAFIDEIKSSSPLRKLAPDNVITEFPGTESFFLHSDLYPRNKLPKLFSVILFSGGSSAASNKLRVHHVVETYSSENEAMAQLGITPEANAGLQNKPEPRLSKLRPVKDEDMDRYFVKQFESVNVTINRTVMPTQSDLERNYAMNVTKMSNDIDWLNRHFKWVCNGEFPKRLEGAHSEYVQSSLIAAFKQKHMVI